MAPLRDGVSNAAVVSAKLKLFVFGGTTIHRDKASKVGALCYLPASLKHLYQYCMNFIDYTFLWKTSYCSLFQSLCNKDVKEQYYI